MKISCNRTVIIGVYCRKIMMLNCHFKMKFHIFQRQSTSLLDIFVVFMLYLIKYACETIQAQGILVSHACAACAATNTLCFLSCLSRLPSRVKYISFASQEYRIDFYEIRRTYNYYHKQTKWLRFGRFSGTRRAKLNSDKKIASPVSLDFSNVKIVHKFGDVVAYRPIQ